jgi:hypothetical protein
MHEIDQNVGIDNDNDMSSRGRHTSHLGEEDVFLSFRIVETHRLQ